LQRYASLSLGLSDLRIQNDPGPCPAVALLHRVHHVEDRQVHRDHHAAHDEAEDHDHRRLHQPQQGAQRDVHVLDVEVGALAHQKWIRKFDIPITIRVGSGSSRLAEANMLWNVGMTKMSRIAMAIMATEMMTPG